MEEPLSPPYDSPSDPSWAPPNPATRYDRGPADPGTPPPRGGRPRRRLTAVIVVLALLLGIAGYAVLGDRSTSTSSSVTPTTPATSTPTQRRPRASAPATTSPPQTAPASGSSGDVGVSSASTTALNVGVVDVNTTLGYQGSAAAGTGIVLSSSGEVLTNNHVVDGSTSITVTVVTTGKTYQATVVGTDPTADVAVLQLKSASGLDVATLGDSSAVQIGDAVTAVGNAGGVGGAPSVNNGTVTDLDQSITASDGPGSSSEQLTGLIQMNASLQPGDSGGPLYNAAAQVIGMDTAGSAARRRFPTNGGQTGSQYFAIPINAAVDVAKQIESGTPSDTITIGTPGFLGVDLAADGASGGAAGATIAAVVQGTPAEKAGLQVGDTITAVDDHAVDSATALGTALKGHHGGDKVSVTWVDGNGTQHTSSVTLATGPAN
jgi:S1-C subfamily serine protease